MTVLDIPNFQSQRSASWIWTSSSLTRLVGLLTLYVLAAMLVSPNGFGVLFAHYFRTLNAYLPLLISLFCAASYLSVLRGVPASTITNQIMSRMPLIALMAFGLLIALTSYTTIKFMIPHFVPFYADTLTAQIDAGLHGGDPWVLAHQIWPDDWSPVIMFLYAKVWFVYWFATPIMVALWLKPAQVKQYFWSFLLTLIICGAVLALAFSSVGPVLYEQVLGDPRFAGLTDRLQDLKATGAVLHYADYLLDSYRSQSAVFGTGISALPSMHVAIVVLNAWLFSSLNRWAGLAAWGFAALIMFGSVYTGWHYAIDGYLSFIAVSAIWFGVRRIHMSPVSLRLGSSGKVQPTEM